MIQSWLGSLTHFCCNQIKFFALNHCFDLEPLSSASLRGSKLYC